ncbi:PREDICTED: uncharacterized protein LOC105449462 [Wasmannia auropunctata]|uniref:uncharacterized protein LOC105449462 n=1 Tax=Wasmannia auropunctata TaxID=64793 RepID=UPI0005EFEED1|nr:PREDICTED: uncharacterized protein LOC105449462 [Wasmannia auropunctata]
MPQISLFDPQHEITYILNVSEEDAKRAKEDLQFATHLLNKHMQNSHCQSDLNPAGSNAQNTSTTTSVAENVDVLNIIQREDNDSQKKDNFRWPHEAILLLLQIYSENEHQLTSGKTTHKKFWDLVASKLIEHSYDVTGIQCKSKMAGLKNTYKNVKDHNNKSGNNRRTWQYFDIMDEMFIKKPWVQPVLTLDSENSTTTSDEDIQNLQTNTAKRSLSDENKLPSKRPKGKSMPVA